MYLRGMSRTCTQKLALLKIKLLVGVSESYLWITTKCLSKLQGWFWIIRSASSKLSKTKSTLWSPSRLILKPLVDLHNCLKVLATTSIIKKRGVKNFAANIYSLVQWSVLRMKLVCSFSDKDRLFQVVVRSSMNAKDQEREKTRNRKNTVSLEPWRILFP